MISTRDRQVFDEILDQTVAALPEQLHELLEEVPLIVEDEPSRALLDDLFEEGDADGGGDLCGLHWGTALTERSVEAGGEMPGMPDTMMLFRGPILRMSGYQAAGPGGRRGKGLVELRRQIKITLLHEMGHHFGLDEDDLDELGYG